MKINVNDLIKDLLFADPTMSKSEIFTHCEIILTKNNNLTNDLWEIVEHNKQIKENTEYEK